MSNSFSFNAVDLADYGLVVNRVDKPLTQAAQYTQLRDRGYAFDSFRPPLILGVGVSILAATHSAVLTYLDSIRGTLNHRVDKQVIFDTQTDRYWMARFDSMEGMFDAPTRWSGTIMFVCHDPAAYDITEVDTPHVINASPDEIIETPGGTDYIYPVYTLIPGDGYIAGDVLIKNLTTDEELIFTEGPIHSGEKWVIDVANWLVTMDGDAAMSEVTGKFPRLAPGIANSIKVTNLYSSVNGSLNITYRNRFL